MSDDNVTYLTNTASEEVIVDQILVDELIALTERAKAGQVVGMAYITLHPGRIITTSYSTGHGAGLHDYITGAAILSQRLMDELKAVVPQAFPNSGDFA